MRRALGVTGIAGAAALIAACTGRDEAPPEPDAEAVALGRAVYAGHCAACHGPAGEGAADWRTPNELGELPAPPHDSTGHTWKHADAMLYHIVRQGWRDPFNRTDRLTMPAYEEILSPEETRAVIIYLKTLWTPQQRAFQREESHDEPFPQETGREH